MFKARTKATVSDLGLTRQQVSEARQLHDAEAADPGVIRRALDARLQQGQEPTKAAMRGAGVNQRCARTPRSSSTSAITVLLL